MMLQEAELIEKLRLAGLRPTRQRLSLATILFSAGDRHVSAESLHQEAVAARMNVSLATVYNTLNQFKAAGLLREVAFEGDRTFFDTNTSDHFHYYLEETGGLVDIGTTGLEVRGLPELPPGTEIDRIDIIVRLRKSAVQA
jgi:Fur family transcriptional regulator, iron response regulator